jgi:hypothetical protein
MTSSASNLVRRALLTALLSPANREREHALHRVFTL